VAFSFHLLLYEYVAFISYLVMSNIDSGFEDRKANNLSGPINFVPGASDL